MIYQALKPLLFRLDAERAHDLTINALATFGNAGLVKPVTPNRVEDPVELMGLRFANRVGLAAGLDKNARCLQGMQALGFGFLEVGTVTPLPQPGNPRPRLFRLPEYEAIINRMGFNNGGVAALVANVAKARARGLDIPLGINIGKNKLTEQHAAVDDYLMCLREVAACADYVTINLSSPNTPGLRDLQFGDALGSLLQAITRSRAELADATGNWLPLLVKVAPDMARDDLLAVADQLVVNGIEGVIATNTTVSRDTVANHPLASEAGGLSGKVLMEQSTETVRALSNHLQKALVIVGVGGIQSAEDALIKCQAGADLVQLYSGLIYRGPGLIHQTANALQQFTR